MGSYSITTEGEEALAAATAETLLLVAGNATVRMAIYRYSFAFDGTTSTAEPVVVRIKRGNSASQGVSSAATEEKFDPADPSSPSAGFHSFTAGNEPTYTGQALHIIEVHPQGGWYEWIARDESDMLILEASTNSFIGIEATAPAIVNAVATMCFRTKP